MYNCSFTWHTCSWEVQWQTANALTPGLDIQGTEYFSDDEEEASLHSSSLDGVDWNQGVPIVEFEINIRCTPSAELEWWGRSHRFVIYHHNKRVIMNVIIIVFSSGEARWTVWRTAKDVLDLHTSLSAQNVQHMPVKRPRLRTSVNQESAPSSSRTSLTRNSRSGSQSRLLNHDDMVKDMRSITAYLRTLLSYRRLHGSILTEFLGANEASLPDPAEFAPTYVPEDDDDVPLR